MASTATLAALAYAYHVALQNARESEEEAGPLKSKGPRYTGANPHMAESLAGMKTLSKVKMQVQLMLSQLCGIKIGINKGMEKHLEQSKKERAEHGTGPCVYTNAPHTPVHLLTNDNAKVDLLTLGAPRRPLVLNFGSCS